MVQLTAYSNFQDRLVHALGLKVEEGGPLQPVEVALDPNAMVNVADRVAPDRAAPPVPERLDDPEWTSLNDTEIRGLLSKQQKREGRIRVPTWDEVLAKLPPGASHPPKPVRIKWSLVCMGYQPMLGSAWSACTRGFALDAQQDRVFEESLFWVVTRTIHCFY
jgi:hypothetical protein